MKNIKFQKLQGRVKQKIYSFNSNLWFAPSHKIYRTFCWTPPKWFGRWKIIYKRTFVLFATHIAS